MYTYESLQEPNMIRAKTAEYTCMFEQCSNTLRLLPLQTKFPSQIYSARDPP